MNGIPLTEELKASLNQFYVYAYIRQRNSPIGNAGTPYYIGKGKDDRAWKTHGKTPVPKDISRIIIIGQNLTEEEAFTLEVKMIASYGRVDNNTGILRNMTDGGDGSSGAIRTDATKLQMSEARKGRIVITNGIKDKQIYPTDPIPSGWKIGRKPYTDAWKINLGKTTKGKTHITDGINERRIYPTDPIPSGWKIGRCPSAISNAAQKGRIVSVKTRRKMSEASKHRTLSEKTRRKLSEIRKGKIYITDGINNRVIHSADPIPSEWRKGRSRRNTVASGSDIYAFLDGTS